MLNNVKSVYFQKIVYPFLNDKRKLELVKYNKKIQAYINIDINHYKLFAGKYIVYEKNGKGKEYNFKNELIFEGEYLNRKRNGKGKLYNNISDVIFEGEYLNGKRNGKGKGAESHEELGILIFEGEYKNDKKWNGYIYINKNNYFDINKPIEKKGTIYELKDGNGIFKIYNDFGNKNLFEGEYVNGELNGKYKEYYKNGNLSFEIEYKNGKKWNGKGYDKNGNIAYELINGKGHIKEYYNNSDELKIYFECDYLNGEKNGIYKKYSLETGKLVLEKEYKDGKKNGRIKEYDEEIDQLIFEGEYLYDRKIKGKEYITGRLEYEGEYLFDKKWNGKGYDENGNIIYELKNGTGSVIYYDFEGNKEFEGEYLNGKKNGYGIMYNDEGKVIYEGEFKNDFKYGSGKEYNDEGILIYEGEFKNDFRYGSGKLYDDEGILIYEGDFINNAFSGYGIEYDNNGQLIYEGLYIDNLKLNELL